MLYAVYKVKEFRLYGYSEPASKTNITQLWLLILIRGGVFIFRKKMHNSDVTGLTLGQGCPPQPGCDRMVNGLVVLEFELPPCTQLESDILLSKDLIMWRGGHLFWKGDLCLRSHVSFSCKLVNIYPAARRDPVHRRSEKSPTCGGYFCIACISVRNCEDVLTHALNDNPNDQLYPL